MENQVKLIASDLDGTLLLGDAQTCSEELYELVEALSGRGVLFVPASGRQYASLHRLFAPVDDKVLYLCENGALVMDHGTPLFQKEFEYDLAMEIAQAVCARPECEIMICCPGTSYTIPKTEAFVSYMRDEVKYDLTLISDLKQIQEPVLKVSVYMEPESRAKVEAELEPLFGKKCCMVESGNRWIDFAPFGISKGSALEEISRILNIAPSEMAAFGDNENDRTMLEYVGHPYLMENCNPVVEDIPARRCSRVEDELRKILADLTGSV